MKVTIFLVLAFVAAALAGGCEDLKTKHKFAAGETYNPIGECVTYKCVKDGEISAKACPDEAAIGCEKLPEDLTKPYPDCCPKFTCA